MPVCAKCGASFPNVLIIEGRARILNRRRYCVACSPFARHNTRQLERPSKPKRVCPACQCETDNAKYCSNQCQQDAQWRAIKVKIEDSGAIPVGISGHSASAKRYLLEIRGRRCAICSLTEWRGQPMPLVLDHINGNADDWRVANLRLVCGNCDMQLPTFKSKNRGKGRAWRRLRYSEGKSY